MSAQAEELARQLLEKTEHGKIKWQFVPDPEVEAFKCDAEDGISFSIKRRSRGDQKTLTFELFERGRLALADVEDNQIEIPFVRGDRVLMPWDPEIVTREAETKSPRILRFRLYSDLFYAARETSDGKDLA